MHQIKRHRAFYPNCDVQQEDYQAIPEKANEE
jgi:hypothetical protein